MAEEKPLGQVYHDEVEALKSGGMSNADAIRHVADKHGKNENAVRGGIHQYRSKHATSAPATRRARKPKSVSVDDVVASARRMLEDALHGVDREVEAAKAELEAAQRRYEHVVAGVEAQKKRLEDKIEALL
jgi:transposase-like protein